MNATIVSAEAKARLAEAVNHYTPPAPEKYRALNEVKESIIALRERKASYRDHPGHAPRERRHRGVASDRRRLLPRGSRFRQGEEAASSQDAADPTTGSRPGGIDRASANQPFTVTRTAHHACKKSLAQQRRCRQSRRITKATQKPSAHPKKQKPLAQVPRPTHVTQPCNARSSRTDQWQTQSRSASVSELGCRRSGTRLHSCRSAAPPAACRRQLKTEAG